MTTELPAGNELSLPRSTDYRDIVDATFLRFVLSEGLNVILGAGWITRATLNDTPGEGRSPSQPPPRRVIGSPPADAGRARST